MRHTQTVLYNGRQVELVMGYDTPIGGYFMVILPQDSTPDNPDADPETGVIYSNLDDAALPFPRLPPYLTHYQKVLREMNIEVPPLFFAKVLAD